MSKIKEIESFDWPSKQKEIRKHSFRPRRNWWAKNWLGIVIGCGLLLGVGLLAEARILDPMLVETDGKTDNAEYCKKWLQGEYANDYQPEIALVCAQEI